MRGSRGIGYCKSMPGAVRPYERLLAPPLPSRSGNKNAKQDDKEDQPKYPQPTDRLFPRSQRELFNRILDDEGLKLDRDGNRRTAYSLRHTYTCLRLMEGADIYQIAKTCRTSVETKPSLNVCLRGWKRRHRKRERHSGPKANSSDAGKSIVQEVFGLVKENPNPERSGGRGARRRRGAGNDSRSVPTQSRKDPASVSSPPVSHHVSCAWNRHAFRCDGHYEPGGPGCRRPKLDHRSARASARQGAARWDGRAHLVAVFTDLPEVAALRLGQWGHGPVVNHQDLHATESGQKTA